MRPIVAILLAPLIGLASAALTWLWWRSPIPTFLLFTPILQGMISGIGLTWIVGRLGVRCRVRRTVIGLLAGVVSVIGLTCAQYVSSAHDHRRGMQRAMMRQMPVSARVTRPSHADVLDEYDRLLLEPIAGQVGLVGYIRFQDGRRRWGGWLRGVEALLVIGVATAMMHRRAGEECASGLD